MSCGGVTLLLLGLGMGPPMVSPTVSPICPQCIPCPQDEPAAVATLLLPGLGTGTCPHHGVPSMSNTSPIPGTSHLPAALLRDQDMSSPWCPQCVPTVSPTPGQAFGCSHLAQGCGGVLTTLSPVCPSFAVPNMFPTCPQHVPKPWEKLLAVATCPLSDSGPGPIVVSPACP